MKKIPLFPLPLVLLPGEILPLRIFEPRYLEMVAECMKNNSLFGITPEIKNNLQNLSIGTSAEIISWEKSEDKTLHIIAKGKDKFKISNFEVLKSGLKIGETVFFKETDPTPSMGHPDLEEIAKKINSEENLFEAFPNSASDLAYFLASRIGFDAEEKIKILIAETGDEKLDIVRKTLKTIQVLSHSETIH